MTRTTYSIETIINQAKKTGNWSEKLEEALIAGQNVDGEIGATDDRNAEILGGLEAQGSDWKLFKIRNYLGEEGYDVATIYIEDYKWADGIHREELERDEENGRLTEDEKRTLENYRLNDEREAIGEEVRAKILGEEPKRESETLKAMKREETLAWRRIADLQKRLKMECENLTGTDATVANQAAREIAWISSELKNETTRLELMTGIRERLEAEEKGE